jgi:predicted metalloendopeptidase
VGEGIDTFLNATFNDPFAEAEAKATAIKTADRATVKAFDWHTACMDAGAAEKAGGAPLAALLLQLGAHFQGGAGIPISRANGTAALVFLHRLMTSTFYDAVSADEEDGSKMVVHLGQSGLGMPNRDYYLKTDADSNLTKAAYRTYMNTAMGLAVAALKTVSLPASPPFSASSPTSASSPSSSSSSTPSSSSLRWAGAAAVLALETRLAAISIPTDELRDAEKTYNPVSVADLQVLSPCVQWQAFFSALSPDTSVDR